LHSDGTAGGKRLDGGETTDRVEPLKFLREIAFGLFSFPRHLRQAYRQNQNISDDELLQKNRDGFESALRFQSHPRFYFSLCADI
jgi:hypothetical protein